MPSVSLFFLINIPVEQCWFWDNVGCVGVILFYKFQGHDLLGDKQNFKREDVKKGDQTPLPTMNSHTEALFHTTKPPFICFWFQEKIKSPKDNKELLNAG